MLRQLPTYNVHVGIRMYVPYAPASIYLVFQLRKLHVGSYDVRKYVRHTCGYYLDMI